ncbi:MAG: gamma-glutamyl-gamma-aminobutyrate hydrolase family protein [Bdellovibrionaceae bacterium]|nr:gamma-glutamyl-gamma-aminobutyrate hydrolase family protein [Pseudobdellovibrionaceae bacterium]
MRISWKHMICLASWVLLVPAMAFAKVSLFVWQATEESPRLVMVRSDQETPQNAVHRYLRQINANADLRSMLPDPRMEFRFEVDANEGRWMALPESGSSVRTLTAVEANQLYDMTAGGSRMDRILRSFLAAGAEPYVIPVAADLGLSALDAREFQKEIAERFDLLVSIGGEDIDPQFYGQARTEARDVRPTRDRSELSLVRAFKARARGVFFGICRGHQMGAVADGHQLHQDLSVMPNGRPEEHLNRQGRDLTEKQTWHHILVEKGSLLARLLSRTTGQELVVMVNSLHHQSVALQTGGASHAVATHDSSGVEALEGDNGLSLSTQFHPEFPENVSGNPNFSQMGAKILRGIVAYSRYTRMKMSRARTCSDLFR